MTETEMLYARLASNVVALGMLGVSWRWRNAGRLLFVLSFLWAGCWNMYLANTRPEEYLTYAPLAYSAAYSHFILGYFASHVTPIVSAIAAGQLTVAVLIALRGRAVQLGLIGAIVFLLAIAPLGVGSGFPSTLIMAAAAAVLVGSQFPVPLWSALHLGRRTPATPMPTR